MIMANLKPKLSMRTCAYTGVIIILSFASMTSLAQDSDSAVDTAMEDGSIEEVLVTAKLRNVLGDLVQERLKQEAVVDLLSADAMSRVGDSTVSAALLRVPGLTVVNDKFVYIRGLGERYSSTQLNGAVVPSPDLTRNVLPLDIFPTGILDSISVQKSYSADLPAAFGGGNIDIRTKGIPKNFILDVEFGTGTNLDNDYFGWTYAGGSDDKYGTDDGTRALPTELGDAIQNFQGDLSIASILTGLRRTDSSASVADAQAVNSELATALNRNVDIKDKDLDPAGSLKATLGNKWYFGESEDWEFGFLTVAAYDNEWKNRFRTNRGLQFNADVVADQSSSTRTINEVGLTGALNFGLAYLGEHEISSNSLFLRNTEDEATIQTQTNNNFQLSDGQRLRNYAIRFEQRELVTNQIRGEHTLGENTQSVIGDRFQGLQNLLNEAEYSWYYSDSRAMTDIPNEVNISAIDQINSATGVFSTSIRSSGSAADYRFTTLQDDVESYGWNLKKPYYFDSSGNELTFSTGWDYAKKARSYYQTQFNIGTINSSGDVLEGSVSEVFSDQNILDANNGFDLSVGGIGTESYLAAQTIEGAYGKIEWLTSKDWRVVAGVRWEQFQQASLAINPLEFDTTVGQVVIPASGDLVDLVFVEDDYYPALSATKTLNEFWGARDFNLRFSLSETVSRPDLREISESTYIDPLTEFNVSGNPDLVTSSSKNYDVRAEWFFDNRDNVTVSAFYKDIDAPIEAIEVDGSENNIFLTFINADSASLYGVEVEVVKGLDFLSNSLGTWTENFFVTSNFTLSDSEVDIGNSDLAQDARNPVRPLSQHSDKVFNFQLGFDSPNGKHNATLAYNTFSERLYFAGKVSSDDAYEQPFNSVNIAYSYYPSNRTTLDFKIKNLLDEELEIAQGFFRPDGQRLETDILSQTVGTSASIGFKYSFGE